MNRKHSTDEERLAAIKASSEKYYANNKEKMYADAKEYRAKNKEKEAARGKRWRLKNRDKCAVYSKTYQQKNKEKVAARRAKRHAAKLQRTPQWLTKENYADIESVYLKAKLMTEETGIKHHVDHIIPLQGDVVSGLHVFENLQILTADENLKKSNNF